MDFIGYADGLTYKYKHKIHFTNQNENCKQAQVRILVSLMTFLAVGEKKNNISREEFCQTEQIHQYHIRWKCCLLTTISLGWYTCDIVRNSGQHFVHRLHLAVKWQKVEMKRHNHNNTNQTRTFNHASDSKRLFEFQSIVNNANDKRQFVWSMDVG